MTGTFLGILITCLFLALAPQGQRKQGVKVEDGNTDPVSAINFTCDEGCSAAIIGDDGIGQIGVPASLKIITIKIINDKAAKKRWVLLKPVDGKHSIPDNPRTRLLLMVTTPGKTVKKASNNLSAAITAKFLSSIAPYYDKQDEEKERAKTFEQLAQTFWLTPTELEQVITKEISTQGTFHKGLIALHNKNYPLATKLLSNLSKAIIESKELSKEDLANVTFFLGQSLYGEGKYIEAIKYFEMALRDDKDELIVNDWLGVSLHKAGIEGAEKIYRHTLELKHKKFGEENAAALNTLNNLAYLLKQSERTDESMALLRQALALKEKTFAEQFVICGKVRPATLDSILTWVREISPESPKLRDLLKAVTVNTNGLDDNCVLAGSFESNKMVELLRTALSAQLSQESMRKLNAYGLTKKNLERQLLLQEKFLNEKKVFIKNQDGQLIAVANTDKDGNFKIVIGKPDEPTYTLSTEIDDNASTRSVISPKHIKLDLPIEDRPVNLLARTLAGYQQSGASFRPGYYFDASLSKPLPFQLKVDPDFGESIRAWGTFRIAEQAISSKYAVEDFSFSRQDTGRIYDFLGGLEIRFAGGSHLLNTYAKDTKQKFSMSSTVSFGFQALRTAERSRPIYNIPDQLRSLYPKETQGKKYVAFDSSPRSRLTRQYYVGFRVQSFFFNRHNIPLQRFPAQFDFGVGQNEYVTGGRLSGLTYRADWHFPLPHKNFQFLSVYGTALFHSSRVKKNGSLTLESVNNVPLSDLSLVTIPIPQPYRHYYRVGVGVDLISLFSRVLENRHK